MDIVTAGMRQDLGFQLMTKGIIKVDFVFYITWMKLSIFLMEVVYKMAIIKEHMKTLFLIPFLTILLIGCTKSPLKSVVPPTVISLQINNPPAGFVSVYYFDSTVNKNKIVQINSWKWNYNALNGGYADSIPAGNFVSEYLFKACAYNNIKKFKLKFSNKNAIEEHDLFINFKLLPPPGGFSIPNASIDGKLLDSLPASDSIKYGHYDTGFIYNH